VSETISNGYGERPLVAVLYRVPLVCEAIVAALDPIVSARPFPARIGDLLGLLGSVRPDAIVVDSDVEAEKISLYARIHEVPLLHIDLRAQRLLVFHGGDWRSEETVTAESVRNAVAGVLFGRREVRA
jgi:hypothetical protein